MSGRRGLKCTYTAEAGARADLGAARVIKDEEVSLLGRHRHRPDSEPAPTALRIPGRVLKGHWPNLTTKETTRLANTCLQHPEHLGLRPSAHQSAVYAMAGCHRV